ncbi:hypothetical protein SUGI_0585440 [Cryptomeria japonica]|uniref:uncharacterized protein LOC131072171 n=1 Tax=Cryptomeria japonica TaxID=3369 RepID=UPI002414B57E|nr:uncharacterized protein LOC131072171 [Cryptomeria japonica]GLJ29686.1 hypothetical protein SUGI_0585440 [Cryptomeria japonica]
MPVKSVFRQLLGWNKNPICGNLKEFDYGSDYSISYSEGPLERWEKNAKTGGNRRVVVVVDESKESRIALQWTLIHVVNHTHQLILLHILDSSLVSWSRVGSITRADGLLSKTDENAEKNKYREKALAFTKSLETFCISMRPDVKVESVVSEGGDKTSTVVRWSKQLEASILVVGQKKPSMFGRVFSGLKENIAEACIANTECLTVGVRKRSSKYGGYMINSKEVKNFWLLA